MVKTSQLVPLEGHQAWHSCAQCCHIFQTTMDSVTTFNVSGQLFSTSTDTLLREPSSRLAAIARKTIPCIRDNQGNFFLDRDPRWFQLILNHLRDGWCSVPASQKEQEELLQEIRHYQLVGFEAFLRSEELTGKQTASMGQTRMGGREVRRRCTL